MSGWRPRALSVTSRQNGHLDGHAPRNPFESARCTAPRTSRRPARLSSALLQRTNTAQVGHGRCTLASLETPPPRLEPALRAKCRCGRTGEFRGEGVPLLRVVVVVVPHRVHLCIARHGSSTSSTCTHTHAGTHARTHANTNIQARVPTRTHARCPFIIFIRGSQNASVLTLNKSSLPAFFNFVSSCFFFVFFF